MIRKVILCDLACQNSNEISGLSSSIWRPSKIANSSRHLIIDSVDLLRMGTEENQIICSDGGQCATGNLWGVFMCNLGTMLIGE